MYSWGNGVECTAGGMVLSVLLGGGGGGGGNGVECTDNTFRDSLLNHCSNRHAHRGKIFCG